jgi:hypothetical protein
LQYGEAWVGDTFRIFPGKYGEDPLWGDARDLKFANGRNADEAFHRKAEEFTEPVMPPNAPEGKARRWDGTGFDAPHNGVGAAVKSLQIPAAEGGGPTSSPTAKYYWGPSVSWNTFLNCWVMLMARAEGPSWQGGGIYISFNLNQDLGKGTASQDWTTPQLLVRKPGHTVWYPSLQLLNTPEAIANKNTCLKPGREARLFYKDNFEGKGTYLSEYTVRFEK